ncbi:ArnT family glycosyltransferase [Azospirillum halopraeferens]|uniref:ArnT family glycosyltransferase n=1 Tax=Azospirillum halopraeferens TaxID=34010 RepID=UPI00041255EE|nr:glycosyltransferase family 39 protein [Azospirillum halopraeferens]
MSDARRLSPAAYLLLTLLSLALFLPGFTVLPPFDRDEARFAQASFQMLESGDLVDIRFRDEARHKKPVGIYWLQAGATAAVQALDAAVGKAVWTYRIPSLAGAVLAVLLTAWVGARLFGATAGALAGVMLAGCVVMGVEARMAKTDAALLATIVAAQGALALLYAGRAEPAGGRGLPALFWVAQGLGILIKGPITPMVSVLTIVALVAWDRRAGWLRRLRPLEGLAIVALIALPWLIAITVQTDGAFFRASVGHDMLAKVGSGQEGKGLPPGYYLGTFWITFAPWAFLALLAVPWVWRHRRTDAVRFCLAWIVPTWLVFEAVPTKLLHYTLPTFPAIALLTAAAALAHADRAAERPRRALFAAAAVLGAVGLVGLAVAVAVVPWLVDGRIDSRAVALVPVVLVLFVWALVFVRRGAAQRAVAAAMAAAALLYGVTYAFVLPAVDGIWVSRAVAQAVTRTAECPTPVVASAGYNEPSLVFLVGTRTLLVGGAAAAAHLQDGGACPLALVESRFEAEFRAAAGAAGARALAEVRGFNYNNGRRLVLTLYAPPR